MTIDQLTLWAWIVIPPAAIIAWLLMPIRHEEPDPMQEAHLNDAWGNWPAEPPK